MSAAPTGFVYLVGAGPGHPGLITLRAVECLRQANLVLYDHLVPEAMLDHAPPTAERVPLTDLAARHVERCGPVLERMVAAARQGKRVVRLKGGDPLVFGRGGEEAAALREAGIPFEIVPGVTAALGAAAFAGVPLTHRACASAVALVTGHEEPGKPETALDWPALARFPGTLAVYMGMARLEHVVQSLVAAGKDPHTPALAVQHATLGVQKTVEATLADLPARVQAARLAAPAVILIGPVITLRSQLTWFEELPLFGKRVLVTRPRHQAAALVGRLIDLGAAPLVMPTVEIGEPADWGPVDAALRRLKEYHWLVFTSANGVEALIGRLRKIGLDLRALGSVKLAAIGPKTAEALRERCLEPDLVPARYQSEDLAAALKQAIPSGQRVLLARADRGRELLREELTGYCHVDQVAVYAQTDAVEMDATILERLRHGDVDYITLTSANIARSLLARLDASSLAHVREGKVKLATISPVTSAEVRARKLPVAVEAKSATMEGLVEGLVADARQG